MSKLPWGAAAFLLFFGSVASAASGAVAKVELMDSRLGPTALSLALGQRLLVEGVALDSAAAPALLELERFEIFAPDAKIILRGEQGEERLPVPQNAYFRGHIAGDPASWAVLTVRESGGIRGLVAKPGRFWVLASPQGEGLEGFHAPAVRAIDATTEFAGKTTAFQCGADALGDPGSALEGLFSGLTAPVTLNRRAGGMATPGYTARVGIETDFEFYQKFGNATDATDYIGDLFAYTSTVYEEEVDTSLLVETIFLYSTASDPWAQTASDCGLAEFGAYWNTESSRTSVTRTIAHFLSGKNTGGGIAWLGVLCSSGGTVSLSGILGTSCPGMADVGPYFGAYGYSGSLSGNFNINNPGVVWDLYVVAHEIGHNFNSPHTHCYGNLGGNANPVDRCSSVECGFSGCNCASPTLPCGTPGGGCGTIMSYCHLRVGGYSNIAFTFGQGHPYGTAPERVPARMNDHVVSLAGTNPSCLAYVSPAAGIFTDGFESGDLSSWSATVP